MKKPKIPEIGPENVELFSKRLILAMLSTNAEIMTQIYNNFEKDGYILGDFEVKVTKIK